MFKVFNVTLNLVGSITNNKFTTIKRDLGSNIINFKVYNNKDVASLLDHTIQIIYKNSLGGMYLQDTIYESDFENGTFSTIIPDEVLYHEGDVVAELIITKEGKTVTSQQFEFSVKYGIGDSGDFVPVVNIPTWRESVEDLQMQINNATSDLAITEASLEETSSQLAQLTKDVKTIVVCTQSEYNAITPVATTLYLIGGE